mmetsp:Transcript_19108/g.29004  ORF Transcript_19108/g.29004 Transcript_19108/m.29004 type:complete len:795 (-) Transcript_19108:108-2492(-)|eukprot:CAMPEP_0194099346 /NCGR_PEP_ID=MMETSP0150-20130528/542_1 /TAXON_ID=122233 /ORGANISM="Chaetoceros debilis, Strain MM31A-1" /LENGTH=794 /DNA_ID=CAMNT_0038785533 /DNA_START=93 /DNA_END=2477 /DNA_ORIENTATION=+
MACNLPTGGIPSTVNPDLIQERAKATFDPSAITAFFDGDASRQRTKTARRRQLESLIANDPSGVFDNDTNNYMHRTERHVRSLAKHVRLIELCRSLGFGDPAKHGNNGNSSVNDVNDSVSPGEVLLDSEWYDISAALADDLPTALHWVMFLPNIISLCDEEQQKRFLPLCRDWRMIGCYAQTEVGHGSNVRALETTATFLKEGEHCPTTGQVAPISIGGGGGGGGAWIINSPTLTSTKFWPGTLGRTCNHAMVIARLIDAAGVDHGVHNFLVQTRSMEDHSLMPGVTCGDIGPKIGYNVMDNGFAKFEHVLIPRRNMAMRFAVVDEDGVYSKKTVSDAASKVAYITMMQVRSYIILEASKALRLGTTMVIRYSAVRKQGFTHNNGNGGDGDGDSSKEENQILDYMQQQHRLFPLLASSYCIFFTGKKMLADLKAIEDRLVKLVESDGTDTGGEGEGEGEDKGQTVTKTQVGDIHASLSALKSFTSTITADGIEDCRKACGGHGFLMASGFPELITSYLQNPTVEGDNQMLPMQVVKVLLKLVKDVQSGKGGKINEWIGCDAEYLLEPVKAMLNGEENASMVCSAETKEDMMNCNVLLAAYENRTARLLVSVAGKIQVAVMSGTTFEEAWNASLIQMGRVSRAHSTVLLLKNFIDGIHAEEAKTAADTPLGTNEVSVLMDLATLFGLYFIEKEAGDFLEGGYMTGEQIDMVRECTLDMMKKIRPNAVALVDANDFSDFRLKSVLGRYDGNVYPALLETSKKDPLNATEPGPGYEQHLKRLIVDGVGKYTGTASRL